jgi:hypothetical protein
MSDRLMTYDELATFLGRTPEAARQLVKRKRWRRVTGNDGKARITVPFEAVEELEASRAGDPATTAPAAARATPDRPPADRPDVIAVLTGHISRLERELETARQRTEALEKDRDAALTRSADRDLIAVQLDALRAVLDAEKARTEEWKAVADRFASQAERLTAAEARRGWWPWRRRA